MSSVRAAARRETKSATDGDWTAHDTANAIVAALLCTVFMALRWKKMGSLLWLDPAHWLNEISRTAQGEIPYCDFSFQYPPLVVYLYGWLLRVFGVGFTAVQVITDVIDCGVIACSYVLVRRLFPRSLQSIVIGLVVAVCSTSLMNFNLFSYETYSPSLQTGALGVLLLLFALQGYVRTAAMSPSRWVLGAVGGLVAVLSKPESALATGCLLALAGLMVGTSAGQVGLTLRVAAVSVLPAAAGYGLAGMAAGFGNLRQGITGYGLATEFCPWWPTGVGLFGMLAYCGAAAALAALFTIPKRRTFHLRYGPQFMGLLAAGAGGVLVYSAYVFYESRDALTSPGLALAERVRRTLPYVIYTNPILEPVLWVTLAVFVVLARRILKGSPGEDRELLLTVSVPAAMCLRSLFGTTQSAYPEVAAICYPFLMILGPYFLWRFLSPAGPRYAASVVALICIGYSLVRVGGGWSDMLSDQHYGTLSTAAGTVKLRDYDTDAQVYGYVMSHTSPGDYLLDLPYGGGVNFASGRRDPIFNVQLWGLGVPAVYEQLDVDRMQKHPPKAVIGLDEANFGTYWGFGQRGNRACPCPRLVWMPDQPSWDPNHVLPIARYIEEHFHVEQKIGDRAIWVQN